MGTLQRFVALPDCMIVGEESHEMKKLWERSSVLTCMHEKNSLYDLMLLRLLVVSPKPKGSETVCVEELPLVVPSLGGSRGVLNP